MRIYGMTKRGTHKKANEDRIGINKTILSNGEFNSDELDGVFSIADGVSGNKGGEIASHMVISKLSDLDEINIETLGKINDELIERALSTESLSGMATTLSGVKITDKEKVLFHIGNTRVYSIINGKYLKQLTTDDIRPDRKNEITACFGANNKALFNLKIAKLTEESPAYILTTDGIHDYVDVDVMEDMWNNIDSDASYMEICRGIIKKAEENGSIDDKSMLIIIS